MEDNTEERRVALLDRARVAITQATTIEEVKDIRDKMAALQLYVRQRGSSWDIQTRAGELKLRAEYRMGQMLSDMEMNPGGNPLHGGSSIPTLAELGIGATLSHRVQTIAAMPESELDQYIEDVKDAGPSKELTSRDAYQIGKAYKRERERMRPVDMGQLPAWDGAFRLDEIHQCAVEDLALPAESVDMVFTDPPYNEESIPLYDALGRLALHVLKPGGFLAAYCSKMYLSDITHIFGEWLDYVWIFAELRPGAGSVVSREINDAWRSILVYRKPGISRQAQWARDITTIFGIIEAYTRRGEIVLDPFVGGGTIPTACKMLDRHYIGFDVDATSVQISRARLNGTKSKSCEVGGRN